MGGGGSSGFDSIGDIKKLEELARKELRRGQRRNTFLSFNYDDIDDVNLLRAYAKNEKSDIEFIDRSVKDPFNSERVEYIKQKISEHIKQCSQTIVYLSKNTKSSEWVKWEVEKSIKLEKSVIAVHKEDTPPSNIPDWLKDNNIKIIPWNKLTENI